MARPKSVALRAGEHPHPAVGGVGDDEVAAAVDRHPGRLVELAGRPGETVPVEAGPARARHRDDGAGRPAARPGPAARSPPRCRRHPARRRPRRSGGRWSPRPAHDPPARVAARPGLQVQAVRGSRRVAGTTSDPAVPGVGDEEVARRVERDARPGCRARRGPARCAPAPAPPPSPAAPARPPGPVRDDSGRARRARPGPRTVGARRTSCRLRRPRAPAAGHSGRRTDRSRRDRHADTERNERRRPPCPHPKRPSAPGTSRSPATRAPRSTPTRPFPPATGRSPGSWSSTTCPGGTRAPRRSRGASPPSGYNALCPNLYARQGLDVDPDDAAAAAREAGGIPDEQFVGDAAAAVDGAAGPARRPTARSASSATAPAAATPSSPR